MKKGEDGGPGSGTLFAMAAAVVAVWILSAVVVRRFFSSWQDSGPFGDTFGAINALFSGLAFAGLIYTILLQRKELALQRNELQLTREEMRGQREQMEAQAATLKLEQFESTFFQLLRVHGDIVNAIDLAKSSNGAVIRGRDCFRVFYDRLKASIAKTTGSETEIEHLRKAYSSFYRGHESEVGHYFRHLYHVIKFVDQSDVVDKRRYTSFVRAQLSSNETDLLFYNCLSEQGEVNFKPLVEKYGLLKHRSSRPGTATHRRSYLPMAFLSATPSQEELASLGAVDGTTWRPAGG